MLRIVKIRAFAELSDWLSACIHQGNASQPVRGTGSAAISRIGPSHIPPILCCRRLVHGFRGYTGHWRAIHIERPIVIIRRILFPVDFSERSKAIAPYVLSIAQRYKAGVVLMSVIEPPPPMYAGMNTVYPETFDFTDSRVSLLASLSAFGDSELPKVALSTVVDIGDPSSLIVDYAHDNEIDIICLPTHGYGPFRRALLGSVTAKVLHDSKIPVWTSAHAPEPSHRAHPQPRHILVAIDTDKHARETLDAAASIAKDSGATLDIVTAVSGGVIAPGMGDADLENLLIEGTRELLAKLQSEAGTEAGTAIEMGGPAQVVHDAVLSKRADLVVVGRRTVHGLLSRLHDDAYAIIRESPCPVLSV
jgi:nucleotide-binding universal stress UspA family protein